MIDSLIFYFIVKMKRYFNIASFCKQKLAEEEEEHPPKLSICTSGYRTHTWCCQSIHFVVAQQNKQTHTFWTKNLKSSLSPFAKFV